MTCFGAVVNMAQKVYRAGRLFNKFLKLTIGSYMKYKFNYSTDTGELAGLEPPYMVLANHTNFWDPFLLSMCIPEPVYFVTSDTYFRNPILKQLLKLVGAIPKTKSVSDPSSIKSIISVTRNKGIIGIFPEGRRNWDGTTLPLLFPTAKLIKSLKLPVISVLFNGAYLSMPRWADNSRKGKLAMKVARVLDGDECSRLSAEEIYDRITKSLEYSEYDFQRSNMLPYRGRKLAEKLELFLFTCPECEATGSMESCGDRFFCRSCGYSVKYDEYGFFRTDRGDTAKPEQLLRFADPHQWNLWQLDRLEARFISARLVPASDPLLQETGIRALKGGRLEPLKKLGEGKLALYSDRLEFTGPGDTVLSFNIERIYGENIQYNDQFEFYYDKSLYRFGGAGKRLCAYKWARALEILKRIPAIGESS